MNLPFSIDRSSRIKLPHQVADGLRAAVQSGFWKPGDRLPSSRELKTALGVSVRAPMEALQVLAEEEGLITMRKSYLAPCLTSSTMAVQSRNASPSAAPTSTARLFRWFDNPPYKRQTAERDSVKQPNKCASNHRTQSRQITERG